MYIEPNTNISVLRNVPLDTTFDHTIFFENAQAQHVYFFTKIKYNYTKQSYQRIKRGYIRIKQNANDLYDCNYVMFQNTAYGNKWFYAFIQSVEYINDNVSEISFIIDPMQTWMFDYQLDQCYVLREHSATDRIGDNLVPETVNTGEYVNGLPFTTEYFNNWRIVVVSTSKLLDSNGYVLPVQQAPDGGYWGGVYGACNFYYFNADSTGIANIKAILSGLGIFNKPENLVAMFMLPASMCPANNPPIDTAINSMVDQAQRLTPYSLPFEARGQHNTNGDIITTTYEVFNGYQPKNNKLYTYPYNYFVAYNTQGEMQEFKFEYFPDSANILFNIVCDGSMEPSAVCIPFGYLQKGYNTDNDYTKAISISNFPKCTWATNDLGAKLVQGGISLAMLAATKGISGSYTQMGQSSGKWEPLPIEPVGYLPEMNKPANRSWQANNIPINTESSNVNIKLSPQDAAVASYIGWSIFNSHTRSTLGRGNSMYVAGGFEFFFKQVFIDAPFASIVDDYFTRFGYACNKIKVPNINARPHWSYVKTSGCTLTGSIPCDDAKMVCDIYNNGITFWKNGNEVGNYSLDNRPIIR